MAINHDDLNEFDFVDQRQLLLFDVGQQVDGLPQKVFFGQRGEAQQRQLVLQELRDEGEAV